MRIVRTDAVWRETRNDNAGPDPAADADRQGRARNRWSCGRGRARSRASIASVLIGAAAVVLFFISAIVLVALKPPSLRIGEPTELYNVDHKPITDGLSKSAGNL